jgi:hypothetical protein
VKYILRKAVFIDALEVQINKENYAAYKESVAILTSCMAIEEINDANVTHMVRGLTDPLDTFDVRLALNIRLMSLLTLARLYVDQFCNQVKKCIPRVRGIQALAKSVLAKEYDENREYRFMEEFRNHAQHRDLPIHWVSSRVMWTDLSEDRLLEYSMSFGVRKSFLNDNKFKKTIIDESPDEVDLKSTTRCYIESLSKVHEAARELIKESVQNARQNLEDAYSQYKRVYPESSASLSACSIDDQGATETVLLLLYWDDIRVKLQKRNQKLVNLKRRYITGKAEPS